MHSISDVEHRSVSPPEHLSGSPLPELARAITTGAVRLAAATAGWLRLVAEFDERGGWHGVGITSCAHWLAWQCGLAPVTAREHVRVARALRGLPRICAAFTAGRLSYAKVRALTRIAAGDCEVDLLEFALSATASQTERFCRTWRRVDDDAAAAADAGAENGVEPRPEVGQSFQSWTDEEGYLTLKVRMPAEAGAALLVAIDSLAERDARRERAQNKRAQAAHEKVRAASGRVDRAVTERCAEDEAVGLARERTAARRITALGALAEARVTLDRRPGDPSRREVVVHVDAAVLAEDTAAGRAHYEGGPAITGAQARRLLCEATAIIMLEQGREPLAVGRRRRRATKAQRRALLRRDGGCARPGCPETRIERLHAHHMRHWLFGGRTDLANLVLLCDTDHGLVHDHDLILTRHNGTLIVLTPDGRHLWGTTDAAFTTGLARLQTGDTGDVANATDPFVGVHPIDGTAGRRPTDTPPGQQDGDVDVQLGRAVRRRSGPPRRPAPRRPGPGRPDARRGATPAGRESRAGRPTNRRHGRLAALPAASRAEPAREAARLSSVLFPDGEPTLPDTLQDRYDRMDLRYAIWVLMSNRDLTRRLATEASLPPTG
jgi:hypothetical protein